MKSLYYLFIMLLTSSCLGQEPPPLKEETFDLEKLVQSVISDKNIPGMAIGIVKDGEAIFAKGFGYANVEEKLAATDSTVYQIGSVTKMFTGYLLSTLIHLDSLSLSDPVTGFFPETIAFPRSPTGQVITIKEIATHSAELPRYPANLSRIDPNPIKGYSQSEMLTGIEQLSIDNVIGERYQYSNFGYGILGTAMANHLGKNLSNLMDDYIFSTYGMKSSSLNFRESLKKNLAVPYLEVSPLRRTEPWNMESLAAAGNVFSTIADLNRFMIAILARNAVNKIQQTRYLKINESWNYGLGCFIIDSKKRNTKIIYHGGDIDGYASSLTIYPEHHLGIAILVNWGEGQVVGEAINLISESIVDNYIGKAEIKNSLE